ncbi:MAG: glycerate kinase [Alphaproteobacteria bacterium]|nr:glycerate kinase [Alphaproteobacteria bacterium]
MVADEARALLRGLFDAAVARADPAKCLPPHLPAKTDARRVLVLGAGKASASMARAIERHAAAHGWLDRLSGLVVTRYGHAVPCERIRIVEAAHPVPDAAGAGAAAECLALAGTLGPDDLLLCPISGGGSALWTLPGDGLELADKRAVNQALLRSGAAIGEINCVRKHLSAIKGGRLAVAAGGARVLALLISDVPGDDPAVIASGPTVPDPTTLAEARAVLTKYGIVPSEAVARRLADFAAETPKPGQAAFARVENRVVAAPSQMLEATAMAARASGLRTIVLGDALEGEARDMAAEQAHLALILREKGEGLPAVILSGGELTVTVRGGGRGGPNAEFVLGLARALGGAAGIHAIACDTDGIDGTENNAGALCGPDTLARARAAGLDPDAALAGNDAYGFFAALGDLVVSGPTLTNVNDIRAILVLP